MEIEFDNKYQETSSNVHNQSIINHGDKNDENPEQLLAVMFVRHRLCFRNRR